MKNLYLFAIIILIFVSACTPSEYFIGYETTIDKSQKNNLNYSDASFSFSFFPVHNGIYMAIQNRTDQPARILWDESYFISPDGNSSRLLNIDLIDAPREILAKQPNKSLIPENALFARFTTSELYINKNFLNNININIQETFRKRVIRFETNYLEFVNFSRYWPLRIDFMNDSESTNTTGGRSETYFDNDLQKVVKRKSLAEIHNEKELEFLVEYLNNNNNLGIGICIEQNEKQRKYKFDFVITDVSIIEKKGDDLKYILKASIKNSWEWQEEFNDAKLSYQNSSITE